MIDFTLLLPRHFLSVQVGTAGSIGIRSPLQKLSSSMKANEMSRMPYISKSKFLQGLQCPKLIWSAYNAKHLFPDIDAALQAVFDQGHEVGAFAKRMFPNGIEIDADPTDFEGAIQLTQKALPSRRPIFEATFSANGGYARADILNPVGKDEWDIIEVKSTTSLKDVHIPDLAFQAWVLTEPLLCSDPIPVKAHPMKPVSSFKTRCPNGQSSTVMTFMGKG